MDFQAIGSAIGGTLERVLTSQNLEKAVRLLLIVVGGYLLMKLCLAIVRRLARKNLPHRVGEVLEKVVKYGGAVLIVVNASEAAGIDLSAALGAAGIAGIAVGFAAQTSISNIISGLFLFSEKSFEVGDVILIDTYSGVVESVDLLSVKIRTFDNRLLRVPNETLIKANIINVTRWPERRLDVTITLPYGLDLARVERQLRAAAASVPFALQEPPMVYIVSSLEPNGVSIMLGVWFKKEDFTSLKNNLLPAIIAAFDALGVRPAAPSIRIEEAQSHPEGSRSAVPRAVKSRSSKGRSAG
jgi:small-conductance mechanosensitive channel